MPKRRIVQTLVLVALAVLASAALARDPLPGFQELERELDNIAESTALSDTEKKRLSDSVRSAIDNIRRANEFDERARSYAKAVESLPEERNKAAELLRNFKPRIVDDRLRNASPETLEARQIEVTTQMATIRRDLQQLRETLQTERSAPLQTLIDDARQAAATATTSSDLGAPTDPEAQGPFQNITTVAIAARKKWQQARLNALEQQLISRPARLALMETEEQYLAQHLADAETHLESVQAILSSQRSASADELARRFRAISESIQDAPPEVRQAAKENASLATQLVNLLAKRRQTQSELASFRDSLALLDAKFGSLNRLLKLDQFESTALFGAALRRERDTASQALNVESTREFTERELTASRVALFELDERLPPYQFTDEQLRTLHATEIEGLWRDSARSVLSGRQDLVADIGTHLRQYVDELSSLLEQIKSLTARSANYRELLESHLFWIPSAQVIGPASFFAATDTMEWLLAPSHWQQVAQAVRKNLVKNALVYVLGLLLLCFAVLARMRLKQRLTDMEPAIGRVRSDRFALTLEAVGITALLAVPFPMLMFLAAVFTDATAGFSRGVSTAFLTTGQTMLFLEFVLQLVRSKGLAELHFRWKPTTLALIRRLNRWLMVVLLPTVFVMVLLDLQATPDIRDGLGRLALVLLCITIAAVAYQLMKASTIRTQTVPESPRFKERLGYPTLIAAMGVLIALSLLGYHYSATQLLARVVESMFTIMTALFVYYFMERASSVYERQLAFERLITKRSAAAAQSAERSSAGQSGEAIPEIIDSQEIDRHTISQQTNTVLRMLVWIGLIVALAYTWRDLLPVGRSLNDWVIWQVASDNPALQPQSITLWSLIVALTVFTVSLVAVKNLPGVLEVAVLSRLNLAPGTGYAITTVVKYAIFIIGTIAITNLLGADWSKLQWLVAALGVGLGFGLQEIVANFVSGIIILFEKPFRLGDTVTIGGQSGTVTRIQTRATTISDWDRKELIIPNKSFVTTEFINWTLSDAVTRLVIPVGIAYGSDIQLAINTLVEIARRHSKIFDDPAPAALFLGFGDSTLNFELRIFARSVGDRIAITHDLHVAIEQAFREQGIEISYPQRDLHLRSKTPIEVSIKAPKT